MKRVIRAVKDRDAFPFDFRHYIATTRHLSTAAHGANICLSLFYITEGALPEEDEVRMRVAHVYETRIWPAIAAELTTPVEHPLAFVFKPDWTHPYLDRVREVKRMGPRFNANALHSPCDGRLRGDVWQDICARIFKRDNYTCTYCGVRGGALECDHMMPISRGGSNDDDNLTTACKPCNRAKRAMTVQEWMGLA
jgi:hypothetical protein